MRTVRGIFILIRTCSSAGNRCGAVNNSGGDKGEMCCMLLVYEYVNQHEILSKNVDGPGTGAADRQNG